MYPQLIRYATPNSKYTNPINLSIAVARYFVFEYKVAEFYKILPGRDVEDLQALLGRFKGGL